MKTHAMLHVKEGPISAIATRIRAMPANDRGWHICDRWPEEVSRHCCHDCSIAPPKDYLWNMPLIFMLSLPSRIVANIIVELAMCPMAYLFDKRGTPRTLMDNSFTCGITRQCTLLFRILLSLDTLAALLLPAHACADCEASWDCPRSQTALIDTSTIY